MKADINNWTTHALGDLCDICRGSSPRPIKDQRYFVDGTIPWIKIADATKSGKYLYETKQHVNEFGASFSRYLPKGSLIIAASGTLGYPQMLGVKGCAHDGWLIPSNFKGIDSHFLYYYFLWKKEFFYSSAYGAAIQNINTMILKEMEVTIPPLPTQCKIASILSAYDDLIENNTRRIAILEEMAQSIYREWFVHFRFPGHENVKLVDSPLGQIPEGWEAKKLGDALELPYGKALKKADRKGGDVAVYGSGGIVGYHDEFLSAGPGIVVGRKGNVGSVFWSDVSFYPIDTAFYVKSDLPLHYVYFNLLLSQQFLNSHAAVPGLNRNQAYSNPFLIPENDLLDSFTQQIAPIFSLTRSLRSRNRNLRKTRDLLLPKLISGKLDVEDLDIDVGMATEAMEETTA